MFTLAMCFKSESSDYYMITSKATTMEELEEELVSDWTVTSGEARYCEGFESEIFKEGVVLRLIESLQNF